MRNLESAARMVKCPTCPVVGYAADMQRHVRRCAKAKPVATRSAPKGKTHERRWFTNHPDFGAALRARKYRRPQAPVVASWERGDEDARLNAAVERVLYEPHYRARALVVRKLSCEGVTSRVLREFEAWMDEQ